MMIVMLKNTILEYQENFFLMMVSEKCFFTILLLCHIYFSKCKAKKKKSTVVPRICDTFIFQRTEEKIHGDSAGLS